MRDEKGKFGGGPVEIAGHDGRADASAICEGGRALAYRRTHRSFPSDHSSSA